MNELLIFGRELIDEKSIEQLKRCLGPKDIGVLTADAHYGYGHPIGGAVAYYEHISLSGVGFDIACGNKAVRTNVKLDSTPVGWIAHVMDEIYRRISFGMGRPNNEPVDHPVLEEIRSADLVEQRGMAQLAANQLGTVGGGNHFVDLFVDEEGFIWIGVHFGSRGFGHKTTTGFIALSKGLKWGDRVSEGGMDSAPILFDADSELGASYWNAMQLAGRYAYAGRDVVVAKVLEIMGCTERDVTHTVHNHHNFAWKEQHRGTDYFVVRKGCTPASPGEQGFIGANMYDTSVIVEGLDTEANRTGLYSTVHGAGRVMSRTQAAGKKKLVKEQRTREDGSVYTFKQWQQVAPGEVNFTRVQARMLAQGIELRGAGADEAPECYKKLADVLDAHAGTIKVLHRLQPIGVAMAGPEVVDPYKD
jgi:tRNA-splicing ligase RtcB